MPGRKHDPLSSLQIVRSEANKTYAYSRELLCCAPAGKRRYRVAPTFQDRFEAAASKDSDTAASAQHLNVVIITAIPADPCQFPTADLINKLSVLNKQDYAHMHGFELHLSADIIDPNVTAVRIV